MPASTSPTINASNGDSAMTPIAHSRRKSGADNKQVTYASIASTNTPGATHISSSSVPSTRGANQLSLSTPAVLSKPPELRAKIIKPTLGRQNQAALTLVCTNVPESKSGTIKGKLQDDRNQWSSICEAIGIRVEPAMLQRVARHPTSVHSGEPRILRVTLNSADERETVLLSAVRLSNSPSGVRILPDLAWKDRAKEAVEQRSVATRNSKKLILANGITELLHAFDHDAQTHDREQWCYIRRHLGCIRDTS
ncbi:unnamed protein product [Dicrocoelium dendriticum]|nr:unnamed protein product [Dicrocoelium dendriticum]